jgi:hypothetical protein
LKCDASSRFLLLVSAEVEMNVEMCQVDV